MPQEEAQELETSQEEVVETKEESPQTEATTQIQESTPPKSDDSSIYSQSEEEDKESKTPSTWPEDWRNKVAGDDEKILKQMERFQSPEAMAKAYVAAQAKIRSGELKTAAPPENATDEQIAAWREENGIPVEAKDYDFPLLLDGNYDDMDDFGKETVDQFKSAFHEAGIPAASASKIMEVANQVAEKQLEAEAQQDAQHQETVEDTLRAEWGAEFRSNIALNSRFLESKFGENWMSVIMARRPDGMRLADDPDFARVINGFARMEGGTTLESGESIIGKNLDARIEEINQIMQKDFQRYKREGLDKEYTRLLSAKHPE